MIVLGIVGTPAGGKSTAAKFLASLGAHWINADLIARDCLNQSDVIHTLAGRFGESIRTDQGTVDRARVADLVFGEGSEKRENLRFLESVVHPCTRIEIHRRIEQAAFNGSVAVLLDIPLLFESGWDLACDAIWCVDASRETRLRRSLDRGWDTAELQRREANQLPIETKSRLSNHVMCNDATLDALHENLSRHWAHLVRIEASERPNPASQPSRHCTSDRVAKS